MSRASTPDPKATPRGSPSHTPRSTPLGTPTGTPLGTPLGTPQGTPRVKRLLSAPQRRLEEKYRTLPSEQLMSTELEVDGGEWGAQEGMLEMSYTNPHLGAPSPANGGGHSNSVAGTATVDVGDGAFLNPAFSDLDDDKNITVQQLRLMAADTHKSLTHAHCTWSEYSRTVSKNRNLLHARIEKRKQEVMDMINAHARAMHERLETTVESAVDLGDSMEMFLSSALRSTESISKSIYSGGGGCGGGGDDWEINKQDIFQDMQEIREGINHNVPLWLPLDLKHGGPEEYLAEHLFGTVQVVGKEQLPLKLCERVDLVRSFSTKTKWDEMPCGVVDIAVTDDQELLVCDKNNKLLKVFDKNGQFKMLIGHGQIKDPTRVTVLRHTNTILVTDNAFRRIKMYHKDGTFVCDFICDIKYPTSICENYKGDLIVVEFDSRTIMVYNSDGRVVYSFKSTLPNPTHIACTPSGDIIITDWRNHAVRTFHLNGEMAWKYRQRGSGDTQMEQPQGVAVDPFGHVIIVDTSNHRVQVFDEDGAHQRVLIPKNGHGLKLPMVVAVNSYGDLFVGEYQGGVKVFKYLEKIDMPLPNENAEDDDDDDNLAGGLDADKQTNGPQTGFVRLNDVSLDENEAETSM